MASSFQKKTSHIFLTVFIGFIAVSFMFTGYETSMGTPDTVARVGDIQITIRDYQNEYNRQLEFYREMMGGDLSAQQIESFGLKQSAIQGLIQRSLMVQFAREIGVNPGPQAIRDEVRSLPYFQTGSQFDIERYRQILASNGMTPSEFEEMIERQLQTEMATNLLQTFPISHSYIKERERFRREGLKVSMLEIERTQLRSALQVSDEEIENFLSDEINNNQVQELFENRRAYLDQPEEALASHILLRQNEELATREAVMAKAQELLESATPQNFAQLANEHTHDPSGVGEGGSLGWFGRGQMVPEFEEVAFSEEPGSIVGPVETQFGVHLLYVQDRKDASPAQFEDHKKDLAKELVRSQKEDELSQLMTQLKRELQEALQQGNTAKIQQLEQEYSFKYETDVLFSRLDGPEEAGIFMSHQDIQRVFQAGENQNFFTFEQNGKALFVKVEERPDQVDEQITDINFNSERNALRGVLSQKLQESIIDSMQDRVKVRVWENRVL